MKQSQKAFEKAIQLFQEKGGILKTSQALQSGIHPRVLYAMRDQGRLEKIGHGLFRLSDLPSFSNPDLVTVALRVPQGVICLISALSFHEITTEVPHEVYLALPRGAEPPRIDFPPVRIFWFSGEAFTEGVERLNIDDIPVRIYSPEKTLADCFKYRNKIGMETVIQSLKFYGERKQIRIPLLLKYARICRVEKILTPYLEMIL